MQLIAYPPDPRAEKVKCPSISFNHQRYPYSLTEGVVDSATHDSGCIRFPPTCLYSGRGLQSGHIAECHREAQPPMELPAGSLAHPWIFPPKRLQCCRAHLVIRKHPHTQRPEQAFVGELAGTLASGPGENRREQVGAAVQYWNSPPCPSPPIICGCK